MRCWQSERLFVEIINHQPLKKKFEQNKNVCDENLNCFIMPTREDLPSQQENFYEALSVSYC